MLTIETLQQNLKTVILLCSSSRGGSSITTEFLRQRDDILHLPAEFNPILRIHSIERKGSGDLLDVSDCTPQRTTLIWRELIDEIGTYNRDRLSDSDWIKYSKALHKRISWQWPNLSIDKKTIQLCVLETRKRLNQDFNWNDSFIDKVLFHCFFIKKLRECYPQIDPRWYDLSEDSIQRYFGRTLGPLVEPKTIIEEPPFVLISPWKQPTTTELQAKPLLIKTPSNAYRIPFFRELFKKQELKILHLKRDAQSSINGLLDGWRYNRGFHAHFIHGFDLSNEPTIPYGTWKYDLPPNFESKLKLPLPEICAFQWNSAHRYILENRHIADAYMSMWFQNVIDNDVHTMEHLWNWLGVKNDLTISPIKGMPLVMATCPPRERRWFEKKSIIEKLIKTPTLLQTMNDLKEP